MPAIISPCIAEHVNATLESKPLKVLEWCQESFSRHRIPPPSFPKNTDPSKTYTWRYIKALARKIEEWGFDDVTARAFINAAAEHISELRARKRNVGLSILYRNDVLDKVYDRLIDKQSRHDELLCRMAEINDWLVKQAKGKNRTDVLLRRKDLDALPNIVKWYQTNKLPLLFIVASKSCQKAVVRLRKTNPSAFALLPKPSKMITERMKLDNSTLASQIKKILGTDWRE